ncbi:MAG: phosphoribosylanthranilate isomerase [Firmicutes bacterium]|nr:phosphoribosylanthranilate isomerase [Bacillota bacterium]
MTIRVKICGLTTPQDAQAAAEAGADAIGIVFAPSPRRVEPDEAARITAALPPFLIRVGVFVDEAYDTMARVAERAGLDAIQLHGKEGNRVARRLRALGYRVIKAVRVRNFASIDGLAEIEADAVLLDAYDPNRAGGTGTAFDWSLAQTASDILGRREPPLPLILAGGLNAGNVDLAIRTVRPYGVDVSSGVESAPGKKSPERMRQFVWKVRRWDVDDEPTGGEV